jgi:hypothetical protein
MFGSDPCADPFDVPKDATLTVTLVSVKDGGTDQKDDKINIIVYDNTHTKVQKDETLKWGQSLSWWNNSGEGVKVQLKAKGPLTGRDIHIRYEITQ